MNNTKTNRINPLVITNLLLAVIAGSMLWTHVGPSVEPRAQAAQAEEKKSVLDWAMTTFEAPDPYADPNPDHPWEFSVSLDDLRNAGPELVTAEEFKNIWMSIGYGYMTQLHEENKIPRWELMDFRTQRILAALLEIQENTATMAGR